MITHHVFDSATGLFTGDRITTANPEAVKLNTPEGCSTITGDVDPLAQRVDLATGIIIEYQPPQPSPDHEWDADAKRWNLSAEARAAQAADKAARAALDDIDRRSIRALREAAIGDVTAIGTLTALEFEAAPLRADVIVDPQEDVLI